MFMPPHFPFMCWQQLRSAGVIRALGTAHNIVGMSSDIKTAKPAMIR
jgi:hypothetical protein